MAEWESCTVITVLLRQMGGGDQRVLKAHRPLPWCMDPAINNTETPLATSKEERYANTSVCPLTSICAVGYAFLHTHIHTIQTCTHTCTHTIQTYTHISTHTDQTYLYTHVPHAHTIHTLHTHIYLYMHISKYIT